MLLVGDDPVKDVIALRALKLLSVCQKGLSEYEILTLLGMEEGDSPISIILEKISDIVAKFDILWIVTSNELKRFVSRGKVTSEEKCILHSRISKSYEVTLTKNLTLIEEKIYHIYKSKDHSGLKQCLADIEIFLLLYNPVMKLDLFRYWKFLEIAGYEPVTEYSKSMDAFESRANPPAIDLFKIILQLSRFFKEFADFENYNTPEFKHPYIVNKQTLRMSIESLSQPKDGIAASQKYSREAKSARRKLEKKEEKEELERKDKRHNFFNDLDVTVSEVELAGEEFRDSDNSLVSVNSFDGEDMLKKEDSFDEEGRQKVNYLEEIGIIDELERLGIVCNDKEFREQARIVFDLSIPAHLVKFRQMHKEMVYEDAVKREEYLRSLGMDDLTDEPIVKYANNEESGRIYKKTGTEWMVTDHSGKLVELSKVEDPALGGDQNSDSRQAMNMSSQVFETEHIQPISWDPSFYHYKRWIWIMFPWACIKTVRDYPFSYLISRCFKSATKYLSVKEEKMLAKSSLKIALNYKKATNVLLREEEVKKKRESDEARLRSIRESNLFKKQEDEEERTGSKDLRSFNREKSMLQELRDDPSSVYNIIKSNRKTGNDTVGRILPSFKHLPKLSGNLPIGSVLNNTLSADDNSSIMGIFNTRGLGFHRRKDISGIQSINLHNTTMSVIKRDTFQAASHAVSFRDQNNFEASKYNFSTTREENQTNTNNFKKLQGLNQSVRVC